MVESSWAVTRGTGSDIDMNRLGCAAYVYNQVNIYPLYRVGFLTYPVGNMMITDYVDGTDGIHYLEVVIDNSLNTEWLFRDTYLYVGTVDMYNDFITPATGGKINTDYSVFPFIYPGVIPYQSTRTIRIAFSQITE